MGNYRLNLTALSFLAGACRAARRLWMLLAIGLLLLVVVAACLPGLPGPALQPSANPTGGGAALPDSQPAALAFLDAWKNEDYARMYSLLTQVSRDAISLEDFERRYRDVAVGMNLQTIDTRVLSSLAQSGTSQVAYRVVFHTSLLGEISRDMVMNLRLESAGWRVQWDDALILPELTSGLSLAMDYKIPARGNIYDRKGAALAAQGEAVAIGVVPEEILAEQENDLLTALSSLTGQSTESIQARYQSVPENWYVPIGEVPKEEIQSQVEQLSAFKGLRMTSFRSRFYYDGGVASQAVGYVLPIPQEKLEEYQRKGYQGDEKVGATGLEEWAEAELAGKHGVSLYIKDAGGQTITRLAQSESAPAQSVYTTLDKDLQVKLQRSLMGFRGSVVVMERDTGRILALVSSPSYDPNLFEPTNFNSQQPDVILNDEDRPLLNRATQGAYPLGSVFKVITMAAALESGLYTPESTYVCGQSFNELAGITLYDWTYSHGVAASGLLTLPEGLMRSCNPWFWHISLGLFGQDHAQDIPLMARAFGLGSPTGILQIPESTGDVPDIKTEGDATQLAIGQGSLLGSPLQVARYIAAVGNGGTLYRPQIVEKITTPDGKPSFTFKPEAQGTLPVSAENLKVIQDALVSVVSDRRGTAYFVLANIPYVAGKTGTAQAPNGDPHAWFAGYTFANRPDLPDIAVAVMLENAGEGSVMAAPVFRRVVSLYFSNNTDPGGTLPWETSPFSTGQEVAPTPAP